MPSPRLSRLYETFKDFRGHLILLIHGCPTSQDLRHKTGRGSAPSRIDCFAHRHPPIDSTRLTCTLCIAIRNCLQQR